jgi:hypothetical protein
MFTVTKDIDALVEAIFASDAEVTAIMERAFLIRARHYYLPVLTQLRRDTR